MRDISDRIQRYRLSRYAPPQDPVRRRLRWVWLLPGLWLVWVAFVSEHSFLRIWQLSRERARSAAELRRVRAEIERLDLLVHDPLARRELAEHALREQAGMAQPGEIIYRIGTDPPTEH
jgi:cell division protein FtsB